MKKIIIFVILLALFLTSCKNQANQHLKDKIYDDKNVEIDLSKIPQRVITTSPSLTEILFDINEGDKIVGNTTYCDYPEQAKNITKIGNILSIDYEKVISLKPDVIFMLQLHGSEMHYPKLTELNQKIYFFRISNYDDLCRVYKTIAKIFHKDKLAESNIAKWNKKIDSLKHNIQKRNKALFLVSAFPIVAASDKSFINDIIKFAGFENICKGVPNEYPLYSEEKILELNPDYIFVRDDINEILKKYKSWKNLNAFKNSNVYFYNENLYHRPGPRFIQAVEELNRAFKNEKSTKN